MEADQERRPKVSATFTLDPSTYSFSNSQAPNLKLTLLLHHDRPITFYADELSIPKMLRCGAFNIHYLDSGAQVPTTYTTNCRLEPPKRIKVTLDESRFHTLLPDVPHVFSAPFTRPRPSGKVRPQGDPEFMSDGNHHQAACGIDGLEPGHDYVLSLSPRTRIFWYHIRWWEYGTKEEVLRPNTEGKRLDPRVVNFRRGPHDELELDISGFQSLIFRCET